MRFIRVQWRLGKGGRLIRVTRNKKRIVRVQKTGRRLVGRDRERFEIVQALRKKRVQLEREQRKRLTRNQSKMKNQLENRPSEYKAFCTTCKKMKDIKDVSFGILSQNKVLTVKGECISCGKKCNRLLRKATDEEISAYGMKKD